MARSRSEEHTSELQSHSEISYAVFCLKKKKHRASEEHTSELQSHSENSYAVFCAKQRIGKAEIMEGFASNDGEIEDADEEPEVTYVGEFVYNDMATTETDTNLNPLATHDALPI